MAERLRREAEAQLKLLTDLQNVVQSDFYSYRYFASEGFLPGYNFPRLPLSAYIPGRRRKKGRDEFLSRPRFLAISEFGPRAIIYHEGSRYIINKVILPVEEEGVLITSVKQCEYCGYLHPERDDNGPDLCERCKKPLTKVLRELFRLQNVSTKRREKINSDEEERLRLGYDLKTGFRFAHINGHPCCCVATVKKDEKELAKLTYGHAATLHRINLGWTRRKNKDQLGYVLDLERGYWAVNEQTKESDEDDRRDDFLRACPELVIVDEAHSCAHGAVGRGGRHQRYELIKGLAGNQERHMIFVTATPHSGKEEAFRSLLTFLNTDFAYLPDNLSGRENEHHRRRLAGHFIQRRRANIRHYMQAETPFPDREEAEETYKLSNEYKQLFDRVLSYARETVIDKGGHRHKQRVRWWSALALLRSLASSPAAAAATLRSRAATADTETAEEADEIGQQTVLDLNDEEISERLDIAPGCDIGEQAKDEAANRRRLLAMAREADKLKGEKDQKIKDAVELVKSFLKDGYRPILFCRFIPTADYVAEELRDRLPRGVEVASITGTLPPKERENRILQLAKSPKRVLVCTDCLSEGINLQDYFDAVMHYDLCWNPTRHEQREGRVDRFGQPQSKVRVLTYYGIDNQIDGIVLDVLIRKHRKIHSALGYSVAVPASTNEVIEAIFEGLLLREQAGTAETYLPGFEEYFKPKKEDLFAKWDNATEKEKRSRTMFAQETIKVDEVSHELKAVQSVIGSGVDVATFTKEAFRAHKAIVTENGDGTVEFDLTEAPRSLRDAIGSIESFKARFEMPVQDDTIYLNRTHPIVEGLANYVMNTSLDQIAEGIARRAGVVYTKSVQRRTTVLLVRYRYHIITKYGDEEKTLLAEDCRLLAFAGSPTNAEWLDQQQAETLLLAKPDRNITPEQASDFVRKITDNFDQLQSCLNEKAKSYGQELLDAHQRVRKAAQARGVSYRVQPKLPPGCFRCICLSADRLRKEIMQTRSRDVFATIRTEGALLPADILQRIGEGDDDLEGLKPSDYHLVEGEKLNEAISRSWNRLLAVWNSFRAAVDKLPGKDIGTTLTREKWLLPLFQELGYGRLPTSKAVVIEGKSYPISHFWQPAPIHLIGCRVDIDRRTAGVAGAARVSPHGLVQEFLNRSEPHLWAFVSNGLRLRILRDNVSLTRQAFVEFDLAGMMDGEVYSDFILLWLLCHQSRVEVPEDKSPEHCWLEKWSQAAQQRGTRALDQLRNGVEEAIKSLGSGFLSHLANTELKEKLKTGTLDKQEYYRQLLRTVYRLIFIFASEDRGLLLDPQADQQAKDCYMQYYSATRLRKLAQRKRGTRHCDLWRGLSLVFDKFGSKEGCPELALPALGSFLWSREAIADLDGCDIANRDLLEAVRALAFTVDNNILRAVDYKNLGSEELGSVYESLLELYPELNVDVGTFELSQAAGSERKTTGSYYTPSSLVNCLLDSALEPVLDEAVKKDNPEQAILNLKVCDPATGSGHFLVAAAHRMAKRLAAIRTGDDEPSPQATRMALRDVIGHCIYGVDMNPMAVELCKVSLWIEALEPGKPLSFLDHHIKCGNSLLGTTPALMEQGIPDDAFKPMEGDIKAICNDWKKQNKDERKGQKVMLFDDGKEFPWDKLGTLSTAYNKIEEFDDDDITSCQQKEKQYEEFVKSSSYEFGHLLADAWCSAFVIEKSKKFSYVITENTFRNIEKNPHSLAPWLKEEIKRLARQYQFFHWHLEFPSVFKVPSKNDQPGNKQTRWSGGFDCVLGNPPWERTALEDTQFFASRLPQVLEAPTTAARKKLIRTLKDTHPNIYAGYLDAKRKAAGETALVADTERFPLGACGRLNTYALFAELSLRLISTSGKAGIIVQTGIATDAPMETFWRTLVETCTIESIFDFENRKAIFPGVHRSMKFCLLTLKGSSSQHIDRIKCGFFLQEVKELKDADSTYSLTAEALSIINSNTKQPPVCRSQKDLELISLIHQQHSILMAREKKSYKAKAWRALMSAGSSQHYRRLDQIRIDENSDLDPSYITHDGKLYIALLEAKQIHQFDPSFATYKGVSQSDCRSGKPRPVSEEERVNLRIPYPRFWAVESVVEDMYAAKNWEKHWSVGIRDVTNSTNERTAIMCILPRLGLVQPLNGVLIHTAHDALWIVSAVNSFVCDYVARQKTPGSHLNVTIFSQLPVPEPSSEKPLYEQVINHSLELTCVVPQLEKFSKSLGYDGPPFVWDEERRFKIRAELDAAYFHLYLSTEQQWKEKGSKELLEYFPTPRAAVDIILPKNWAHN